MHFSTFISKTKSFLLLRHQFSTHYPIEECRFSKNGTYAISISLHSDWDPFANIHMNDSCLILTKLGVCGDSSDFIDITLSHNVHHITTAHFNPQSTLIAAGTTNGVYIWDINGNI